MSPAPARFQVVCDDYRCPTLHKTREAAERAAERITDCPRVHRVEEVKK